MIILFVLLLFCTSPSLAEDNTTSFKIKSIVNDFFFSARFDIQRQSAEQLDSIGISCTPFLVEALLDTSFHLYPGDEEEFNRKNAIDILGRLNNNAPDVFSSLLAQEYNPYHHLVIEYFSKNCWKDSSSRPLLKFLNSKNKATRDALVTIYLQRGLNKEIMPYLEQMIEDALWTNRVPEALNLIKTDHELFFDKIFLSANTRLKNAERIKYVSNEVLSCVQFRLNSLPNHEIAKPSMKKIESNITRPIRLLSLNVAILFDEYDAPYRMDNRLRGKRSRELREFAEYLKNRNADIIALQEVEIGDFLEFYNTKYLSNLGYKAYVAPSNDYRGYSIGFLSRLPLGKVTSHHLKDIMTQNDSFHFIRNVIQLEVLAKPKTITLFNTHCQPSPIYPMYSKEHWRKIRKDEAKAIHDIINEEASDYKMIHKTPMDWIFCGDFNLTSDDTLYKILTDSKHGENWTDLAKYSGKNEFTSSTNKPEERIDYIFVSNSMLKRYVLESFQTETQDSLAKRISDHFGISAIFRKE